MFVNNDYNLTSEKITKYYKILLTSYVKITLQMITK
jgi:hypothetical protein